MMIEKDRVSDKPPIGAKPYKIHAVSRINELLSAIGRYANFATLTKENIANMRLWITELGEQVNLIDTMMIYDEDR